MSEDIEVMRLSEHRYAAEVHEASRTTEHQVTFGRETLDDLAPPVPEESDVVVETVRYLLEKEPSTALPHDIDLGELQSRDADFVPELRARLGG
ncbi:hypothetical protein CDG81_12955 [Actinopolyspora erythraea]|uniref:Uncharacterized protein n=1 Tax=Actinopolyspora erythraea TaxID=414996 RepID=A0A099D5S7_9ACTN|nr:hypothetical protein [Actinopolyspora erythraea]ASU79043.1 hypothetical protein CDG81_12955 [Actinopolyspora erythraea]KGI81172.1 hypothetical protein IL38_13060 [Actinopolyspora erythraea]